MVLNHFRQSSHDHMAHPMISNLELDSYSPEEMAEVRKALLDVIPNTIAVDWNPVRARLRCYNLALAMRMHMQSTSESTCTGSRLCFVEGGGERDCSAEGRSGQAGGRESNAGGKALAPASCTTTFQPLEYLIHPDGCDRRY